jgi:RimJ/RimL family protein N-acetyltransferase
MALDRARRVDLAAFPMGMVVREATVDDIPEIVGTIVAVAPEGMLGVEPPVDVEARSERHRKTLQEPGMGGAWVLEEDGRQLGHLFLLEAHRGVLSVGMALVPEARGRGGGRMLIERAIAHARTAGAHKLELEVWPDNGRAIALYARSGFEIEGLKRDHYRRKDGSLRSALVMGLRLPDPGPGTAQRSGA